MNANAIDLNYVIPSRCNRTQYKLYRKLDKIFSEITIRLSAIGIIFELYLMLKLFNAETDSVLITLIVSTTSVFIITLLGIIFPLIKSLIEYYMLQHPEKYYSDTVYEVDCFNQDGEYVETLLAQETVNDEYYREYASGILIPRAIVYKDFKKTHSNGFDTPFHTVTAIELVKIKNKKYAKTSDTRERVSSENELNQYIDDILHNFRSVRAYGRSIKRTYKFN